MITFQEAIDWALSREVVLPEEYHRLLPGRIRDKAFTIMGIAMRDQLQDVLNSLIDTMLTGGSFDTWKEKVMSGEIGLKLGVGHIDNIFRTNMQTHYNRGHWVQQQENKTRRPWLMYDAVNDSRTRPSHHLLDGVIKRIDDPFWNTYYPPNDFRCRCSTIALTDKQAQERNGGTQEPEEGWPDIPEGFDNNPGEDPDIGVRIAAQPIPGGSAHLQDAMLLKNLLHATKGKR